MIKFYIALIMSKGTYLFMKILKRKASQFPGYIAIKICPQYLRLIKKPKNVICVSGTDGKTTTTNLITDALIINKNKVISNKEGSNTNVGIATTLSNCVNILGKPKVDYVVLEVDEHWTKVVFPDILPNYFLVTNIIRDSLKRNAHPEYVMNKINQSKSSNMKVILNADELCSGQLLPKNKRIFYGIDKLKTDLDKCENIINDYELCPKCGEKLIYNYVRFCHVGNAYCPKCAFKNNEPNYHVTNIDYKNNTIEVNNQYTFPLLHDGIFNIYNEIAIITLFFEMGFKEDKIYELLDKVKISKTRLTEKTVNNIKIVKLMAKGNNSLPVSLVFDYIRKKKGNKIIILALDDYDELKASEYIGWIYDTDYEFLNTKSIKQIIVTGPRCYDHKVRLLLAGIDKRKLFTMKDELKAVEKIKAKNIDYIYILHDMSSYKLSVATEEKVIKVLEGDLDED